MYVIYFLLSLPVVYQAFQKILEPKRTSVNIWSNCLTHDEMEVQKGQMLGSKANIKRQNKKLRLSNSQALCKPHGHSEQTAFWPFFYLRRGLRTKQQLEHSLWSQTEFSPSSKSSTSMVGDPERFHLLASSSHITGTTPPPQRQLWWFLW